MQDITVKLHRKFQINSPNHTEKRLENEVGTKWLIKRVKDYSLQLHR